MKQFLWILILLGIVFLAGYMFTQLNKEDTSDQIDNTLHEHEKIAIQAVKEKNPELCLTIKEGYSEGKVSFPVSYAKRRCYENYFIKYIIKYPDYEYCLKLSDSTETVPIGGMKSERDHCLYHLAHATQTPDYCERMDIITHKTFGKGWLKRCREAATLATNKTACKNNAGLEKYYPHLVEKHCKDH